MQLSQATWNCEGTVIRRYDTQWSQSSTCQPRHCQPIIRLWSNVFQKHDCNIAQRCQWWYSQSNDCGKLSCAASTLALLRHVRDKRLSGMRMCGHWSGAEGTGYPILTKSSNLRTQASRVLCRHTHPKNASHQLCWKLYTVSALSQPLLYNPAGTTLLCPSWTGLWDQKQNTSYRSALLAGSGVAKLEALVMAKGPGVCVGLYKEPPDHRIARTWRLGELPL